MSFFRRLIESFQRKRNQSDSTRVFLQDEELISVIKDVARQQERTETDLIAEFTRSGLNQFLAQSDLQERWSSLSHREQQVVALVCLGSRNYEIAQTLGIAPETVKTHLKHVFDKLGLRGSRELRLTLKDWDFRQWWEQNRHE